MVHEEVAARENGNDQGEGREQVSLVQASAERGPKRPAVGANKGEPEGRVAKVAERQLSGVYVPSPLSPSTPKCGAGSKGRTAPARRSVSAPARAQGHASSISGCCQTKSAKSGEAEDPCELREQRSRPSQVQEPGRKSQRGCEGGRKAGTRACKLTEGSGGGRRVAAGGRPAVVSEWAEQKG